MSGLYQQGYTKQSKLQRIQCIYQAWFLTGTLGVGSCLPPVFPGFPARLTGLFQACFCWATVSKTTQRDNKRLQEATNWCISLFPSFSFSSSLPSLPLSLKAMKKCPWTRIKKKQYGISSKNYKWNYLITNPIFPLLNIYSKKPKTLIKENLQPHVRCSIIYNN